MTVGWGTLARLCLVNAAIGGLAALPINLFNRLMTVELALPAILPGLLVALHYGVQLTRPVWGHRSDQNGARKPLILSGIVIVGLGLIAAAWGIGLAPASPALALIVWILAYAAIGVGIGAAGTSFLALLADVSGEKRGPAATLAWLLLIAGIIVTSIGTGIALDPYSPERLIFVVANVALIALLVAALATWKIEPQGNRKAVETPEPFSAALSQTWADPVARRFAGFVFLSILAFYLSELVFEPFAGHVHGLSPEESTKLSGGKEGAALAGMLLAGLLSQLKLGNLRHWAVIGCTVSAFGLLCLGAGFPLVPSSVALGLGNGFFVVGAVGSMMQLAADHAERTGTRMGVFGAAQAIAAGAAGLIGTGMLDLARLMLSDAAAYASVFWLEAALFLAAALVAARVMRASETKSSTSLVPGE